MGDNAREVLDGWSRKWRTLWCWSRLYLGYKAAQARGRMLGEDQRADYWQKKHGFLAERMWSNIAELRGWWVKVGQFLSTRSDMLPVQYIHHLTKLQDMMPTSKFSVVRTIVESELGRPIEELFESFEESAIASASIGQVHRAVLREGGQKVVVKVQHPGVEKTLRQDMMTLLQMAWAFGMLEKGLNFTPILVEWQKSAANELDFRLELQFQERARIAAEKSNIDVIIPKCYKDLTTPKVMVMEYCEGFKITDMEKMKKYNVDVDNLMFQICQSFAHQIHIDGMFNGDPHPGNILVQINSENGKATPVLLDWGLVKCFSLSEKLAFAKTVFAVANMDVMGLMAAFEEMGFKFKSNSIQDPELYMDAFRLGLFRDPSAQQENKSTLSMVKETGVNKKAVMEGNPIDDWPKDIIFFIRVASLLHGLSLQLKTKIPLLRLMVEKAEQCLLERFIPPSPLVYIQYPPASEGRAHSQLEYQIHRLMVSLLKEGLLLGGQVAVVYKGRLLVDTCVGRMGPVNQRPVQTDSLFCIMTLCNALLTTAILKLVDEKRLRLEDPVCHYWDGFIRSGKEQITVAEVLNHRAGLHKSLPRTLTLTQLCDYEKMISLLEDAAPISPRGKEGGRYAYMSSGWFFSEIIRGVTGRLANQYLSSTILSHFKLESDIYFPVPKTLITTTKTGTAVPPTADTVTEENKARAKATAASAPRPESPTEKPEAISVEPNVVIPESERLRREFAMSREVHSIQLGLDQVLRQQTLLVSTQKVEPSLAAGSPTPKNSPKVTETAQPEQIDTALSLRLTSSRRQIGSATINQQEVQQKLQSAKKAVARSNGKDTLDGGLAGSPSRRSKYAHDDQQAIFTPSNSVTAIELAKAKPYVVDPLIYDSARLIPQYIPPTNCRATASALAKLFGRVATGDVVSLPLLQRAAAVQTIDRSLDTLLLTGGGSKLWGTGFQLYPCLVKQKFQPPHRQQRSPMAAAPSKPPKMIGLGHGDLGGNILVFFPKLKLSVVILVNDVLTGSAATREILRNILAAFGLEAAWDLPFSVDQVVQTVAAPIRSRLTISHPSIRLLNHLAATNAPYSKLPAVP